MKRFGITVVMVTAMAGFALNGWSQSIKFGSFASSQSAQAYSGPSLLLSAPPKPNFTEEQRKHLSGDATNLFYGRWRQQPDQLQGIVEAIQAAKQERASTSSALHNTAPLKTLPTVNNRANDLLSFADTESETTIASANGFTLVGFNSSADFPFLDSFSGYSRSLDGGKTWSEVTGGLPPVSFTDACDGVPDDVFAAGDPVIVADGTGNFYYSTLAEGTNGNGVSYVFIYRSTNGGATFSPFVYFCGQGAFLDKDFMTIDRTAGRIYLTFTIFYGGGSPIFEGTFDLSGNYLAAGYLNAEESQGSFPAVDANGNLYVIWEQFTSGGGIPLAHPAIYMSHSGDHGITFSTPTHVVDTNPPLDNWSSALCSQPALRGGIRSAVLPSMAIDVASKAAGAIYIVWNDMPGALTTSQVMMVKSTNGGGTWSAPVQVNKLTAGDHFQPGVAVAPNGKIGIFYYDRTGDQNNWHVNTALATSTNGGSSFAVSPIMADNFPVVINADYFTARCYMGDYNQPINNGKNFLLAWGDNSNGDPDVFFAKK